jgi:ATP-dependent DNA helicase RecG
VAFLRDVGSTFVEEADYISFEDVCRRMTIVDGPAEHTLPRNVGLMFFHEQPERFFPQTQIDIVQFPDGLGGDRVSERTFKGSLSRQLQDALLYLSNAILEETVIKHPDRAEADRFFNYPYTAIEEILVNAVYHRSYEVCEPIEVRILPDQITITSFPGPDRSISLSDLAKGKLVARRYRNRRVGEFLKELRLTEGRGTGIPKVIRAMLRNGSPVPEFDTDEDRTFFTAVLPIHPGVDTTPQVRPGAEEKVRVMLQYCISPRDRTSIQARLGLKDARNLRQRYLNPAIEAGWP